jgi:hypothetical protein
MLFYEEGKLDNGGLYYECKLDNHGRGPGVFTFLVQLVRLRIHHPLQTHPRMPDLNHLQVAPRSLFTDSIKFL